MYAFSVAPVNNNARAFEAPFVPGRSDFGLVDEPEWVQFKLGLNFKKLQLPNCSAVCDRAYFVESTKNVRS